MKNSIVTLFVSCAFLLAGHSSAQAETVRGFIDNQSDSLEVFLVLKGTKESLKIRTTSSSLLADLRELRTGDFVVARGTVHLNEKALDLDSIYTVGLQELLGAWKSANWEVFEFKDFNKLNLYVPTQQPSGVVLEKAREYTYTLAPEKGNRYSIFLSGSRVIHAGSIQFVDKRVVLTVIDSETGRVSENISLSPLPLQ